MKKFLLLILVAAFCIVGSNALAGVDLDFAGTYSIDSVTIEPPSGGVVWDGMNPASLEEGTVYTVEMIVSYDNSDSDNDQWWNTLRSTITFYSSGLSFTDDDNASSVIGDPIAPDTSVYDFFFTIPAAAAMVDDTTANISFQGTNLGIQWHDIGATGVLPVEVTGIPATMPTPEPATMLLLGVGLLGLVGFIRRKRKV